MAYKSRLEIIVEGKHYAVIDRGNDITEIAVVHNLNSEKNGWDATTNYWSYTNSCEKARAIMKATDLFLHIEDEKHISRGRLEELATLFKDGLIEDGEEEAYEYFTDTCDMDEQELEYFGITNPNEDSEEEVC